MVLVAANAFHSLGSNSDHSPRNQSQRQQNARCAFSIANRGLSYVKPCEAASHRRLCFVCILLHSTGFLPRPKSKSSPCPSQNTTTPHRLFSSRKSYFEDSSLTFPSAFSNQTTELLR